MQSSYDIIIHKDREKEIAQQLAVNIPDDMGPYHPIHTLWSKVLVEYVRETQGKGTKNISISSIFTSDLVVEKMPNDQALATIRMSNFRPSGLPRVPNPSRE